MPVARRREWVGSGARRLREIPAPPFAKTPPVAGYTSWFDGDDLSTITLVGGAGVSQWNDKGSGATNAVQATATKRPVLARHPSLFRGRTALYFGPTSNTTGQSLTCSASASDMTQTSFVVGVVESLSFQMSMLGPNADGGNQFLIDDPTWGIATNKSDTAVVGIQGNATVAVGVPFVAVQAIAVGSITQYLNGVSETDSHSQTFTASRTLVIGDAPVTVSGEAFRGWIGEVLIYDTTLNGTDVGTVTDWLRSKWDV